MYTLSGWWSAHLGVCVYVYIPKWHVRNSYTFPYSNKTEWLLFISLRSDPILDTNSVFSRISILERKKQGPFHEWDRCTGIQKASGVRLHAQICAALDILFRWFYCCWALVGLIQYRVPPVCRRSGRFRYKISRMQPNANFLFHSVEKCGAKN